jgi:hypothetical protein
VLFVTDTWNPTQYDKFQREREQPFFEGLGLRRSEGARDRLSSCPGFSNASTRRDRASTRSSGYCVGDNVLKGTRDGLLKKVQPTSIHGQVSLDVFFTDIDDPDGQTHVARIGPEAVIGKNLEPGDHIRVEYVVGVAVSVTRLVPTA